MNLLLEVTDVAPGAAGDGVSDDASALQAMLKTIPAGATVDFGSRTYLIGTPLDGTGLSNVKLTGRATFIARGETDFEFILDISGTSGTTIEGLTFDANKAQRGAAKGRLSCLSANATKSCTLTGCTFKNSLGIRGTSGTSSVAVAASRGCTGLLVHKCRFLDCGVSANERPSDGIFVRGDNCAISECHAENVTDHGFVLEGCNHSRIIDCTGKNCTSIAGITNDGLADVVGNVVSGITGTCNHFGSFGGAIGAYTFGEGRLSRCVIRDISITAAVGAKGHGAGLFVHGKVDELELANISIDAGSSRGTMNHGIIVDGASRVLIHRSRIRADGIGCCIRLMNQSAMIQVDENRLEHGAFGIYADGTSGFCEHRNLYVSCDRTVGLGGRARRLN